MAGAGPKRESLGRHHPLVKRVRAMVRSGELRADGHVLLETPNLIEDAVASGVKFQSVLVATNATPAARQLLKKLERQTTVLEASGKDFGSLTTTENSPGILALVQEPAWEADDLLETGQALIVVLAGLQDPGNVGAILRTAEAFGATGVLATRGTASPFNAKAVRAASGSLFRLPMLLNLTESEVLDWVRRHGLKLWGAQPRTGIPPDSSEARSPLALALGSEAAGLPQQLAAAARAVTVPVVRSVESLNVAAAAAVLLYEIQRARQTASGMQRLSTG